MLPELSNFNDSVTLVSNTGIQFLDFGFKVDIKEPPGQFVQFAHQHITLLAEDDLGTFYSEGTDTSSSNRIRAEAAYDIGLKKSLELLNKHWLPLPFLRSASSGRYTEGPSNWVRIRFVELAVPDIDGNTHRITLAFDTSLMAVNEQAKYLAPSPDDVSAGAYFKIGLHLNETKWFFDQEWISDWLKEIFIDAHKSLGQDEIDERLKEREHIAHYLNLLRLVAPFTQLPNRHQPKVKLPEVRLVSHTGHTKSVIPVDLVLDVGNSRTCGILVEDLGQAGSGLKHNYLLQIRDLSHPERIYVDPFESRVEFAQASFGKEQQGLKSGRSHGFLWPTIARVGDEANHLASLRQGTEGSTGISSPKRYLWDENNYGHGWRFNCALSKNNKEPHATAAPFANLIDESGVALYTLDEDDRLPVFVPRYSRSSLMTFMLAEVICQALCQINSAAQRIKQGHSDQPRRLNSITLTVPPGMPLVERSLFNERLQQAIALVWKSLGWHQGEESPFDLEEQSPAPIIPLPITRVEWDEASCGQLVYLYTEISENFSRHPEEFFASLARPDKVERDAITLATIDIGGGTTDLVITKYTLDGEGSNVHIVPTQLFRDGFKIAGDDILLDIIQDHVLPSFAAALSKAGLAEPDALMSRLCGSETLSASDQVLRQQLNLQVFTPLGLAILGKYELYKPASAHDELSRSYTYQELLGHREISQAVTEFVNNFVRRERGEPLDLGAITFPLSFKRIHQDFLSSNINITRSLSALCEVVFKYNCDKLLLTGRPSRLPGIQAFIRQQLPLAPGRILPMHHYRTGGWYPFHKNERVDDPKSTASVGALLCLLSENHSLQNFYFRVKSLKPYSIIRHFGVIDTQNCITNDDVLFSDIQVQQDERGNEQIVLPMADESQAEVTPLRMRGDVRLGFRQLDTPRWGASPLYTLSFQGSGAKKYQNAVVEDQSYGSLPVVLVYFKVEEPRGRTNRNSIISDKILIDRVDSNTNTSFNARNDLKLELNTMLEANANETNYWLDSGSVKR